MSTSAVKSGYISFFLRKIAVVQLLAPEMSLCSTLLNVYFKSRPSLCFGEGRVLGVTPKIARNGVEVFL